MGLGVGLTEAAAEKDHEEGGRRKERDIFPSPKRQGTAGADGQERRAVGIGSASEIFRVQMYSMFRSAGAKYAKEKTKRYVALGLFNTTPKPGSSWPSLRHKANQEMKEFWSISCVSLANLEEDKPLVLQKTHGAR